MRKDNKAIIEIGLHKIHNNKLVSTGRIEGTFDDTTFNPPPLRGINIDHWEKKRLKKEHEEFQKKVRDRLGE